MAVQISHNAYFACSTQLVKSNGVLSMYIYIYINFFSFTNLVVSLASSSCAWFLVWAGNEIQLILSDDGQAVLYFTVRNQSSRYPQSVDLSIEQIYSHTRASTKLPNPLTMRAGMLQERLDHFRIYLPEKEKNVKWSILTCLVFLPVFHHQDSNPDKPHSYYYHSAASMFEFFTLQSPFLAA